MDANNINTGISQKVDGFNWFKPTGSVRVEGVKVSAPDFSIPPTPASSYSNLHVILDSIHPSSETITRGVLAPQPYFSRPSYSEPSPVSIPISEPSLSFSPVPSAPSMISREIDMEPSMDSSSSTLYDNKLDDVPQDSFRAVLEPVNPELPGARAADALTSLKSEIAPMPVPFVALEEDFDDLAERTDRNLPDSVDISLVDESQKWSDSWNKIGDDVRSKNWNLHHNGPQRDAVWGNQWSLVGGDIQNKNWNLKKTRPLPSSFNLNSWRMIDGLENAEQQWRSSRGIDGLWSGRINRVHRELINSVVPIGWSQWFQGLKNKVADKSSYLMDSAAELKDAAKDLIENVEEEASVDLQSAKDSVTGLASKVADDLVEDYSIAKNAALGIASSVKDTVSADLSYAKDIASGAASSIADSASKAKDAAKDIVDSASDAIASKVIEMTTTPLPKFEGSFSNDYDFYLPVLNRKVPSDIIDLEEIERADRMSRGINPIVSGMWHRLGREMLHSYRDDLKELFNGLRFKISSKGSDLIESAKDAIKSFDTYKASSDLSAPRGLSYDYEPINFNFSQRIPFEIIDMEETERAYRIKRGINPIVSGLWYRLGLELKYKFSIRPTLAIAATVIADVASDLAGRAVEAVSEISGEVMEKSRELLTPAPVSEFEAPHLNLFAFTAEPVDFTFKSRRAPADIIALEEKERADRMSEGVDVLAYSKWNSILSEPHKTLSDVPSMTSTVLPVLSSAKESLIQSGKGISGFLGSWAHSFTDKAASMIDAAKHSHLAEAAMEYVRPDPSSIASLNKSEEMERARRMDQKVDPMFAARNGRVQEELLNTIRSV